MSTVQLAIGLVLRTLMSYVGIVGLTSFICGAAGLMTAGAWWAVSVSPWHIALLALPMALALGVASLGKYFALGSTAVYIGAYAGICAAAFGDPITFTVQSALRIYNFALYTVSSYGYYSLGNYMIKDGYDYASGNLAESDPERFCGVFLICTLIGVVMYFTVQKKVRIVSLVLFITAVMAPILTYNIAVGTSGIGLTVIFTCAAMATKLYDRRYSGRIEKKQSRKTEKKALRLEKKAQRLERKNKKKETAEKADRIFDAALDAGADLKKARAAKRLFLSSKHDADKAEKKAAKLDAAAQKKRESIERRQNKEAAKKERGRIAALKKTNATEALAAKKALNERQKNARLERKSEAAKKRINAKEIKRAAKRKARKVSFAGGYGAAGVALCVFLALWLPMVTVHGAFKTIDPINNKLQIARAYYTAYLKGNDVDLNDLYAYGIDELTPRLLTFDKLEYENKRVLRVETEGYSNVYLRSWIGTNFQWDEGKWVSADYDQVLAYRDRFGRDFTPDEITTAFYKSVFPSTAEFTGVNDYKNLALYGFNVQQINVWRNSGDSLLLFVPAHMNTDFMLMKYGFLEDSEYKYSNYFDGVYSSRFYKYGRGYSTVSFVNNYSRSDVGKSIDKSLEYWQRCKEFIIANRSYADRYDMSDALYEFDMSLQNDNIDYLGTNLCDRYFNYMTDEERLEFDNMLNIEEDYSAYVGEAYTEKSGSPVIEEIAAEIKAGLGEDAGIYETVRAVADYFEENFTYTTEPNKNLYDGQKPVLEAFLTDVREGYCSHFATAASAILREYGLPVRYCEGYVASGFEPATGGKSASLRTYVEDSDAHAWIEVYVNGIGWMQFEVTPNSYYDDMYNSTSATIDPIVPEDPNENIDPVPTPDVSPSEPTPLLPVIEEGPEDAGDIIWFLQRVAIGAAIVLVLVIIWFIIKRIRKKANDAVAERFRVIDVARNEERYKDDRIDNRATAKRVNDYILSVFELIGAAPETGELSEEYAKRMSENYGHLSMIDAGEVITVMQKEEFGHGLSYDEMYMCAEYLSDIITAVYNDLSIWQKIRLRYIMRKI